MVQYFGDSYRSNRQEIEAEHNLTYEYTVPQTDWANRTVRYLYVEDNGTTSNEYPENSPVILEPERPQYDGDMNVTGFRETGIVPDKFVIGDISLRPVMVLVRG